MINRFMSVCIVCHVLNLLAHVAVANICFLLEWFVLVQVYMRLAWWGGNFGVVSYFIDTALTRNFYLDYFKWKW